MKWGHGMMFSLRYCSSERSTQSPMKRDCSELDAVYSPLPPGLNTIVFNKYWRKTAVMIFDNVFSLGCHKLYMYDAF